MTTGPCITGKYLSKFWLSDRSQARRLTPSFGARSLYGTQQELLVLQQSMAVVIELMDCITINSFSVAR